MNEGVKVGRAERVPLQVAWPTEAGHFTPWLADNLDYLDVLELGPLTLVDQEVQLPETSRSLDILAQTAGGRLVAIENQFNKADHDHLTRGMAYAVGLRAAALVVVAELHAPEFIAVADYLNRCAEAVEADDAIAVLFVTVALERVRRLARSAVRGCFPPQSLAGGGGQKRAAPGERRGVPSPVTGRGRR